MTDVYGSETSWNMIDMMSGSVVAKTSNVYPMYSYEGNTKYFAKHCLPCGSYNFTMFDSWGDGLVGGSIDGSFPGGSYNITIDGELVRSSVNSVFFAETTVFEGGAQCSPPVTCSDSKLKMLVAKHPRSCSWVRKKAKKRCALPNTADHCRLTCGVCDTCTDSNKKFVLKERGVAKRCSFIGGNPAKVRSRCAMEGVMETCRLTCGSCHAWIVGIWKVQVYCVWYTPL